MKKAIHFMIFILCRDTEFRDDGIEVTTKPPDDLENFSAFKGLFSSPNRDAVNKIMTEKRLSCGRFS